MRSIDTSVPVVVLKMHHGSLGIARSLGRLGVTVHGLTGNLNAPPARSRYWGLSYPWDVDKETAAHTVHYLVGLGRSLGRRAVLIAVCDGSALLVAQHAEALCKHFICPVMPAELVRSLTSKKGMHALVRELGLPTAETAFPQTRADVRTFLETAIFPVVVKAIDGARLFARTRSKMGLVHNEAELLALYDSWEEPGSPNLMLQQYIPGGDRNAWMFNGYFSASSDCVAGWTGQKIRQIPLSMGSTTLGMCRHNEELDRITRAFMKRIGYQGIVDIDYQFDARDGCYKVLDINPRIGSSFRLFVDPDGLDVVRAMYLDLTGQPVPQPKRMDGRKWVVENEDIESSYKSWRMGNLRFRDWLRSFRGLREGAYFAHDDMHPFYAMCGIFLEIFSRRIARQFGGVASFVSGALPWGRNAKN